MSRIDRKGSQTSSQVTGRLLVCGSLAYDYILKYSGELQHSLAPLHTRNRCNVSLHASSLTRHPGGCGGNIAYTLALLGERPRLLSIAGADFVAYQQELERVGVDLSQVRVIEDELTASCVILTDAAQNRVVAFYGGATDRAVELDFEAAADDSIAACLIAPDDAAAMLHFANEARRLRLPFLFDIGSQVTALSGAQLRQAISGSQVVLCNDYEMSVFQQKTEMGIQQLFEVVPTVVVTQGEQGSMIFSRDRDPIQVGATALVQEAVDSTGAGDAYRAGFAYGWIRQLPWEVCGGLGSTAAAFVLEAHGTQGHLFSQEQFWDRYHQCFGPISV
jgi:adenosine kinase